MKKILALILCVLMAVTAFTGCGEAAKPSETEGQRSLGIVWPTMSIDFYTLFAEQMKAQAEAAGWKVDIVSYDFNSADQVTQLENYGAMGVTDIITCALDPNAIEDVCVKLRQQGININMFAMAPDNLEAYDSVTVADQYLIGEAIAANASDWIDATFPDAADGSIEVVLLELPTDEENMKRDKGMETIANNPKVKIVAKYEMSAEDPVEAQNYIDMMVLEHPNTKVVLSHFASMSLAADITAMSYDQINKEEFGIFSGDWDSELASRIQKSVTNESLIRATGTYSTNAIELQFSVCAGEHDSELNELKQYVYPIVKITPENIAEYLN